LQFNVDEIDVCAAKAGGVRCGDEGVGGRPKQVAGSKVQRKI
jgi:hypothetical protein